MKDLKTFDVLFTGLKEGIHKFEYNIDIEFFDFFNYKEFCDSNINVDLFFNKKATLFELKYVCSGWVEVNCDVTNELFKLPIKSTYELIVKFGDDYNSENEELIIIPHSDYKLNVAQDIFDTIVLAIPVKRVHPGVFDGTFHSEVLEKLKEYEIIDKDQHIKTSDEIDPRWDKLKNINSKNKE